MSDALGQTSAIVTGEARGILGWTLAMILRAWQERIDAALGDFPAGAKGLLALSTVVHETPPTQAALATWLAMDRTILTYLLDDLEAAGLVSRVPVPGDRRARRIEATPEGRRALVDAEGEVGAADAAILGGLSPDEQRLFASLARHAALAILHRSPGTDPCIAVRDVLGEAIPGKNS